MDDWEKAGDDHVTQLQYEGRLHEVLMPLESWLKVYEGCVGSLYSGPVAFRGLRFGSWPGLT